MGVGDKRQKQPGQRKSRGQVHTPVALIANRVSLISRVALTWEHYKHRGLLMPPVSNLP